MTDTSHPGHPDPDAQEGAEISLAPTHSDPRDTLVQARAALRDVVPNLVTLVSSIPDANSASVGTWTVGDVAIPFFSRRHRRYRRKASPGNRCDESGHSRGHREAAGRGQ
jgi:hypothetical protein